MRRSRFKVAPNLASLNRSTKNESEISEPVIPSNLENQSTDSVNSDGLKEKAALSCREASADISDKREKAPRAEVEVSDLTCAETDQPVIQSEIPAESVPENSVTSESSNQSAIRPKLGKPKPKPNIKLPSRTPPALPKKNQSPVPDLPPPSLPAETNSSDTPPDGSPDAVNGSADVIKPVHSHADPKGKDIDVAVNQTEVSTELHNPQETEKEQVSVSHFKSRNVGKIRPNIENASHRVRTYSSASESEDEGKRLQSRNRPSAMKTNLSVQSQMPCTNSEPGLREILSKKDQGSETKGKKKVEEKTLLETRKDDMKKKFAKGQVDPKKMTMFDLIYYNPDGEKPTRSKEKIVTRRRMLESDVDKPAKDDEVDPVLEERLAEEEEEQRVLKESMDVTITDDGEGKENQNGVQDDDDDGDDSAMPVPQVRLGPNGEIILDEQSLVIETKETKKRKSELANGPVVIENSAGLVNYGSWHKRKRSSKWTIRETARFYRALGMLGTDFSLMESLFPKRTRFELKRKFKVEEKNNRPLIDKTISTQKPFDMAVFGDESDDDCSDTESTVSKAEAKKRAKKADKASAAKDAGGKPAKKKRRKKVVTFDSDSDTAVPSPAPAVQEVDLEPLANGKDADNVTECPLVDSVGPLGQMSLDSGGLTIMEQTDSDGLTSHSLVVPPVLAQDNPHFAKAQPGSLVLVTAANPNDPSNHLVHVYRISSPHSVESST